MKAIAAVFALIALVGVRAARAAEPRPWLCRDKPVFSSDQPMSYDLSAGSRQWRLFLMQFSPGGGHDGFDIVQTAEGSSNGHLAAGRYFAVALHNAGGHWICPEYAREQYGARAISTLCFSADGGGCAVRLTVKRDAATSARQPGSP